MVKRVTIKDVATYSGVSYQTVSRVINKKGEVSSPVRERVSSAIEALGFRPNVIARSMVRGRTHTLGCIAPNLTDFTFACLAEGAKSEARRHGYFVLTATAEKEEEVGALGDEMLSSGRVDGLLAINPYADGRHRHFEKLIAQGAAVVYLGTSTRDSLVSSICLDDEGGAYQATSHLITLGHTRIAMISGPQEEDCVRNRNVGFMRALKEARLDTQTDMIAFGDWSATSGHAVMQRWLESGIKFTALFVQNDRMAVGAIKAGRQHGLTVPQDLAVVGFDDMPLASYFDPPLTTIRQDILEHGRQGALLLLKRIEDPSSPVERIMIPSELIVRQSSGAEDKPV